MPEDATQQNSTQNSDQNDNQNNQDNNQQQGVNNVNAANGKKIVLGADNGCQQIDCDNIKKGLEQCGNTVEFTCIDPNQESHMKGHNADMGVFFCNGVAPATIWSFRDAIKAGSLPYTIFAYITGPPYHDPNEPDGTLASMETIRKEPFEPEHDADQFMNSNSNASMATEKTGSGTLGEWIDQNSQYVGLCSGNTAEELAQNICSGACGGGSSSGSTVSSGGGAQIKDKTFEKCIRRICAATDSIFLVENNAAVLFPYTDWMAFTLRQKISTIKKNEIDPKVFSMEYGNDGFYNKVSIAWGGATLPERFPDKKSSKKQVHKDKIINTNYTVDDILSSMEQNNFKISKLSNTKQDNKTTTKNKKDKTTQEISVDENGVTLLSEQYDKFVEIYGEQEKRVQSSAPDLETAQYIVNALLIQYIRDYNYSCRCRALNNRKYIGGTFYAVQNPFNDDTELFYLNGYTMRTQKHEPMYYDLDFKYGPEGAEEILDYQTLSGGAASGGATSNTNSGGTASEENIWKDAAKCKWAQDQEDCSTQDPATAKKHYDDYSAQGKEVHFDCYGMSAYLYYRFNNEANIPCQVVGDSSHHVVMLDRGNGFESTRDDYRNYNLDYLFKWREGQNTAVVLAAPNSSGSTSGGNTNSQNTNSGNGGSS